jgi:membrane protein implicated in regulation of membrane protease activity
MNRPKAHDMSKMITPVLLALLLAASAGQVSAYIGPGAGISFVGSLLSILATFFVAIGAVLFWPVRKFLKRRKARREAPENTAPARNPGDAGGDDGPGGGQRA